MNKLKLTREQHSFLANFVLEALIDCETNKENNMGRIIGFFDPMPNGEMNVEIMYLPWELYEDFRKALSVAADKYVDGK